VNLSQSSPRQRAGLIAAAVLAGSPLLAAGAAYAEPVESGREVTFSGAGLLGVSCAANPSARSVTIAAETSLRVVNRTGHRATLLLDGAPRGEIGKGSGAEVLFHRGPVSLALKPHCVLTEESSVRVQVITARPGARPVARDRSDDAPRRRGQDGRSTGNSGLGRAAGDGRAEADNQPASPGSTAEEPRPTPSDLGGEPADGLDTVIDDGALMTGLPSDPPAIGGPAGANPAAEPLASVEPMSDDGPIGLLALIAIVCVLGVSAGAIRAILAQRASRAGFA
jgi:hypothetical protein